MTDAAPAPVLAIQDLRVRFGAIEAVRGLDLAVHRGQTHGLVGESGCGKSAAALSVLGLLPRGAARTGRIAFEGQPIEGLSGRALNRLRGDRIGMVFQDPMTSLNPAYTIGSQMTEVFRRHRGGPRSAAIDRAAAMLARVGVPAPGTRLAQYPHQLSGGLRQRVMIAQALLCAPALLIADEPTTALDVTVQAGILRLLAALQAELGLALLLITHDLGVVARTADQVSVMYAGQVVESGPVRAVFADPAHPYTQGLLASVPVPGRQAPGSRLGSIPGVVPRLPPGFACGAFRGRCALARADCAGTIPWQERAPGHFSLCVLP